MVNAKLIMFQLWTFHLLVGPWVSPDHCDHLVVADPMQIFCKHTQISLELSKQWELSVPRLSQPHANNVLKCHYHISRHTEKDKDGLGRCLLPPLFFSSLSISSLYVPHCILAILQPLFPCSICIHHTGLGAGGEMALAGDASRAWPDAPIGTTLMVGLRGAGSIGWEIHTCSDPRALQSPPSLR